MENIADLTPTAPSSHNTLIIVMIIFMVLVWPMAMGFSMHVQEKRDDRQEMQTGERVDRSKPYWTGLYSLDWIINHIFMWFMLSVYAWAFPWRVSPDGTVQSMRNMFPTNLIPWITVVPVEMAVCPYKTQKLRTLPTRLRDDIKQLPHNVSVFARDVKNGITNLPQNSAILAMRTRDNVKGGLEKFGFIFGHDITTGQYRSYAKIEANHREDEKTSLLTEEKSKEEAPAPSVVSVETSLLD